MRAGFGPNRQRLHMLLATAAALWLSYWVGSNIRSNPLSAFLPVALLLAVFVVVHPRLGLYAFSLTLLLIPYDWRVFGISANQVLIGATLFAYSGSLALHRVSFRFSPLYIPLGTAIVVGWMAFLRFGSADFMLQIPYILSLGFVICLLTHQLIGTRRQLMLLLFALILTYDIRNLQDIGVSIPGLAAGDQTSAIRSDNLLYAVAVTTESQMRALILPLLLTLSLFGRGRWWRAFLLVSLVLNVSWMALSAARTAVLGFVATFAVLLVLLPARQRRTFIVVSVPLVIFALLVGASWTGNLDHAVEKTKIDLNNLDAGRPGVYRFAFERFLRSPLLGGYPGPSHSFILGAAQAMGLVFLVPLGLAILLAFRASRWLQGAIADDEIRAVLIGLQATFIVALPLNVVGTALSAGGYAYPFWMLIGITLALYDDVRQGRYAIVGSPLPPTETESTSSSVPLSMPRRSKPLQAG